MKALINYIVRLGKWIWEAYPMIIVIVPSVFIICYREFLGKEWIQFCGGIFQLIGTIYGISLFLRVREAFSFPTLGELFKGWIKRFPTWRKDVRVMAGNVIASMSILDGKASSWSPDKPELPIEERIGLIFRNLEELRKGLDHTDQTISKNRNEFLEKIDELEGKVKSEISQVNTKLESIHMEDFLWALTGLLFILTGTVFSSFAGYFI